MINQEAIMRKRLLQGIGMLLAAALIFAATSNTYATKERSEERRVGKECL